MKIDRPGTLRQKLLVGSGALVFAAGTVFFSPILTKNLLFLAALPFAAVVFLVLVLNTRATFLFLLGTRALLDLPLALTRVEGGSGIGGVLNLFVILMAAFLWARFPKTMAGNRQTRPWIVFLAIGALSLLYSPMPALGARALLSFSTYFCMFAAPFFLVKTEEDKRFWVRVLLLSALLPVAMADLGLVTQAQPLVDRAARLRGTFAHPNILAFYAVFNIMLVFYVLRTGIIKIGVPSRILLWLFLANLFVVLVATQTRSAWFACASFFFIYALLREQRLLFIFIVAGSILAALPPVQSRLKDLTQGTGARKSEQLNSMSWRMRLWESAVPEIKKRPFTGYGLESFTPLSTQFFPLEKKYGSPAHNVFVTLLFETGVFGTLAYVWIYLSMLKAFFARIRFPSRPIASESAMLFSYIVGYLMVCVSDNMLHYLSFNWYFWFFAGVLLAAARIPIRSPEKTVS